MKTEQFNIWIDTKIVEKFEKFVDKHGKIFPKQGRKARVAEAVLEAGLEMWEKEAEKINAKK